MIEVRTWKADSGIKLSHKNSFHSNSISISTYRNTMRKPCLLSDDKDVTSSIIFYHTPSGSSERLDLGGDDGVIWWRFFGRISFVFLGVHGGLSSSRRVGACTVLRERRKGGSISLCVGIQTDLLIVVDVVMNGFFCCCCCLDIFFQKKCSTWNPTKKRCLQFKCRGNNARFRIPRNKFGNLTVTLF